ncbi:MrpF/PhaF family protein [Gammaproteobacteria bacterium AB-CW1]|uniref:MrpF/PhaF family protein n=1 Tax=Natronospira elongata TaxID=3110268 RepID=A0AAP6JEK6_9GAMM|nr:MrpF/PhaF family protein [Gammaproteobacteria bacterium AB-CW1]
MTLVLHSLALFLVLNLALGLVRAWSGPGPADRMLAILLFGTTTVAVLLLLAYATNQPALKIVALLFVMLAAIGSIAFVQLPTRLRSRKEQRHD